MALPPPCDWIRVESELAQAGFQISLNYFMEFNAKSIPNSSRFPNECDLLCARIYNYICCFSWLLASAKWVALLFGVASGRCDLPCGTTYDYICCFSCLFASARRVTLHFLGSPGKGATCLAQGGSRFSSSGQVFTSFPKTPPVVGLRFE